MQKTLATAALIGLTPLASAQLQPTPFVNFESPQTRPVAVSADGTRLFAVNTPDNRLAVFSLQNVSRPVLIDEIPVGLEPVSVTPRTSDEVWVTNRLSDSISVVSLSRGAVIATVFAKDEPADVVFAGSPQVAMVSISGSRVVRVFDPITHTQLAEIPIFGEEPRALARSADGSTVWVAVHRSGNRTTIVPEDQAPPPPLPTNPSLPSAPAQGLIVDANDPQWTAAHGITLPDYDVFEIDVAGLAVTSRYTSVGTHLFGIAPHPTTGELWVANNESLNMVRFAPNLRGHVVDHRVTKIVPGSGQTTHFDLNPGIDYSVLPNPGATATALAQPTDLVWSADGNRLYVAAFGTDRVAVLDTAGNRSAMIELGAAGATADPRNKRGPRGLALHPSQPRLYVLNRLAMSLAVIDTTSDAVLGEMPIGYDPTPAVVRNGRGFLYDAKLSGNGTASCAACHVDGEIDGLAWDLGDPGGQMVSVTTGGLLTLRMHPMKGPMTTQTLRGLTSDTQPFHWRGDKATLVDFNSAFDETMGGAEISGADMDDYAAFMETLAFPPNPNQNIDRTYSTTPAGTSAAEGLLFFQNTVFANNFTCVFCHSLPTGTNGIIIPAFVLQEPQHFKVPQLRNIYKRQGRTPVGGVSTSGFGLLHDGSVNDVFDLLSKPVFQSLSQQANNKQMLENLMVELDTGIAPIVGFSVTVDAATAGAPSVLATINLLEQQADQANCDLVAKGEYGGAARGFWYDNGAYQPDLAAIGNRTRAELLADLVSNSGTMTFTGVPVGSGRRIGIDRDLDGNGDGDEAATPYGSATPACAPALALDANSEPSVGNALFALRTSNATPGAAGLLLLGNQQAAVPVAGITVLVSPTGAASLPWQADSSGLALTELPIPAQPALIGATLYAQSATGAACSPLGIAASNGLAIAIRQ